MYRTVNEVYSLSPDISISHIVRGILSKFIKLIMTCNFLRPIKGKGKIRPRTGHEDPEGE